MYGLLLAVFGREMVVTCKMYCLPCIYSAETLVRERKRGRAHHKLHVPSTRSFSSSHGNLNQNRKKIRLQYMLLVLHFTCSDRSVAGMTVREAEDDQW